jgi:hypothetical protein
VAVTTGYGFARVTMGRSVAVGVGLAEALQYVLQVGVGGLADEPYALVEIVMLVTVKMLMMLMLLLSMPHAQGLVEVIILVTVTMLLLLLLMLLSMIHDDCSLTMRSSW